MSSPVPAQSEQAPKVAKAVPVSLREAGVTESWLESHIESDPTILRLGDVAIIERQRRQEKAGRLDLLLEDESGDKRYEVELMLGSTDESHLIRTFEALSTTDAWLKRLQDSGLESDVKNEDLRVFLTPKDFDERRELLTELLQEAVRQYEKD